ncbi:MAG: DUF4437 domain-containing protein [Gammaproteobacteria bacterium]|nr:DUF4437 domain-containing protein [Gammaproteobacteria bacterium]
MSVTKVHVLLIAIISLAGCAGSSPKLPYPAFVQVDELEDMFMASLPGIRGKQLAGDPQTRRTSNRIDLPPDWKGTSGGVPGRSMELFVVQGTLRIADIDLPPGGYAFLPAGSLGFNLETVGGARILYFVNDADTESVIRSPIIIDTGLLEWQAAVTPGTSTKELLSDPGSGARTWLFRIAAGTSVPWQSSSALREGYLLSGNYRHSECVLGKVHTSQYLQGGYFYRPADAINGGPLSGSDTDVVWFLRETSGGSDTVANGCVPTS